VVQLVDTVVTALAAILAVMFRRILCLIPLLLSLSAEAETLVGKVVGVTDGDTIKVLVEERTIKVRLAEIDTPDRRQPWASRAKQALSDKVFGKEVEVHVVTIERRLYDWISAVALSTKLAESDHACEDRYYRNTNIWLRYRHRTISEYRID
jgi:hypothetical protein